MTAPASWKRMKLRYAGTCRECGMPVGQGVTAVYDKAARAVICLPCAETLHPAEAPTGAPEPAAAGIPAGRPEPHAAVGLAPQAPGESAGPMPPVPTNALPPVPPALPPVPANAVPPVPPRSARPIPVQAAVPAPVDTGTAGASARREFERRAAKREQRIRQRHPKLGGLILALSDDPQSTTAWRTGARGEELLGRRLDELAGSGVRALHDRRIRGSRANIDHIAISSAGVFVLDAKRYKGRPTLRVEGGILRPRTETLMVGGRRCNPLVEGMHKQLGLVQSVIGHDVPITGMLVFIDADWPLIGGDFVTRHVRVLWPRKATERILAPGPLTAQRVDELHRLLAKVFPPA